MTTTKKQKILVLLALFSLSLLAIAPLAGNAYANSKSSTSLFPTAISAQTPAQAKQLNLTTGQTWYYQLTFYNATSNTNSSLIYSQTNEGIVNITDWNDTTEQCYNLTTTIDFLALGAIYGIPAPPSGSGISVQQITSIYLNITNFSIPRADQLLDSSAPGTSIQNFTSFLFNESVLLYEWPLSNGQSWTNIANTSFTGWNMATPPYVNTSMTPFFAPIQTDGSVSGPTNVTVPLGTYSAYQINYTQETPMLLFGILTAGQITEGFPLLESWYSPDAQNFVMYFVDMGSMGNTTIELVPQPTSTSTSTGTTMLLLLSLINTEQQQGSSSLLLIGGGAAAAVVIVIAVVAMLYLRRQG
jgi:hypothetical protein